VSLQTLRIGSLRAAEAEAERLLADAREGAGAIVAQARADADGLLDDARARAREEGRRLASARLAEARRTARGLVLEAREAALERLHERTHAAAASLRGDPGYARLLERLVDDARARLAAADAEVLPSPAGGAVVRADGRQVDLTLVCEVERRLHDLGARVEALWT